MCVVFIPVFQISTAGLPSLMFVIFCDFYFVIHAVIHVVATHIILKETWVVPFLGNYLINSVQCHLFSQSRVQQIELMEIFWSMLLDYFTSANILLLLVIIFLQCIPTPLAWYAHQLPEWFQILSVVGT